MAFAPLVIAAVGTAMTVASSMQAASAAKSAANYNSQLATANAAASQQMAEARAEAVSRSSAQQLGAARAGYGASGVTSEGTPLDVLASSASLGELDRQQVLWNGRLQASGYSDQAALDSSRAGNAMSQGYLAAAGGLARGGADAYSKYNGSASGLMAYNGQPGGGSDGPLVPGQIYGQ